MTRTISWGLPKDWVVAPSIDLEMKRYVVLGYAQRVKQRFSEGKLFPYLDEVHDRLTELIEFRERKTAFTRRIPGELLGFDPGTGEAIHTPLEEPEVIGVIDEVIEFAVPGLQQLWSKGTELHNELRGQVHLIPVGVQPLHTAEGWLLVRSGDHARAYSYSLPLVRANGVLESGAAIRTRFVSSYSLGISSTYEHIKSDLIGRYRDLPTPATFAVETDRELPYIETVMPIAKAMVLRHVAQAGQ